MVKHRGLLQNDRCLISRDARVLKLLAYKNMFLVCERTFGVLLLAASGLLKGLDKKLWISPKSVYEYNLAVYYNGEKARLGRA